MGLYKIIKAPEFFDKVREKRDELHERVMSIMGSDTDYEDESGYESEIASKASKMGLSVSELKEWSDSWEKREKERETTCYIVITRLMSDLSTLVNRLRDCDSDIKEDDDKTWDDQKRMAEEKVNYLKSGKPLTVRSNVSDGKWLVDVINQGGGAAKMVKDAEVTIIPKDYYTSGDPNLDGSKKCDVVLSRVGSDIPHLAIVITGFMGRNLDQSKELLNKHKEGRMTIVAEGISAEEAEDMIRNIKSYGGDAFTM